MARRNDHSREQLRDLAIRSVLNIVDRDENAKVTTRSVAQGMGYTVGTLYLVFRNLDDLLLQVSSELLQRLYSDMRFAVKDEADPQATIFVLAMCYLALAEQYPGRWRLLARGSSTVGDNDELDKVVEAIFTLVETSLARLAPTRNSKEIAIAARALWSAIHGICVVSTSSHLHHRAYFDAKALTRTLIYTYLSGFMFGNIEPLTQPS